MAVMLLMLICHCSPHRQVIENPNIDDWDVEQKHYKNLFPPKYHYMEETEYDAIDFRQHPEMELHIMKMGETYVSGSALPK